MPKKSKKSKSKRMTLKQKYKVIKKVKEHHRKQRKEDNKRKRAGVKPKTAKDPGIPAAWPFKEDLIREIQVSRQRMLDLAKERRDRLKRQREEDMDVEGGGQSIADLQQDAAAKLRAYENSSRGKGGAAISQHDASRRAFYKEFVKVVEAADVIIQVLDARDPLGFRCNEVERFVRAKDPNKRIVLLLNKIDLVPKEVTMAWLKYLREELPTVAFKCSTQQQATNLGQRRGRSGKAGAVATEVSGAALGAEQLLQLLKNYARNKDIKTAITVGVVGLPNVGKSSLINSLKRTRVANVGNAPGVTRTVQEVHLDKHVKLLDSPGMVFASEEGAPSIAALRNAVRVEQLEDPVAPVAGIVERVPAKQLMTTYKIAAFKGVDQFLQLVATARGKLKKGGAVDVAAAARQVIQDWNDGTLRYYTVPPTRDTHVEGSAAVLTEWGREFDLDDVQEGEMAMVEGLPSLDDEEGAQVDSMGAPSLEPLEAMDEESEGSEVEDGMDEGEGGEWDDNEGAAKAGDGQRRALYSAVGQFDPHAARAARKRARKASVDGAEGVEEDDDYDFGEFAQDENAYAQLAGDDGEEEEEEEGEDHMSGSEIDE